MVLRIASLFVTLLSKSVGPSSARSFGPLRRPPKHGFRVGRAVFKAL